MAHAAQRISVLLTAAALGAVLAIAPHKAAAPLPEAQLNPAQQALVADLSRRYTIAEAATTRIVRTAFHAAGRAGLDPVLVLAMIAVESSFDPAAESVVGAKGLMQIVPKYHREKLALHGGDDAVLDPVSNILIGTEILREYLRRSGSLQAALQRYNGAISDRSARYTRKVMAERRRLQQVVAGAAAI